MLTARSSAWESPAAGRQHHVVADVRVLGLTRLDPDDVSQFKQPADREPDIDGSAVALDVTAVVPEGEF